MANRLIPALNRVLVEKIVPPSKTTAGILLPEKTTKLNSGKVVAVGPGACDRDGKHIPVSLREGDTVLLPEYGGTEVKLGDKDINELLALPLTVIKEVLGSNQLEVDSEDDVYNFAIAWATNNYPDEVQRRNISNSELGPLIHFKYMSIEMLRAAYESKVFSSEYLIRALLERREEREIARFYSKMDMQLVGRAYRRKPVKVFKLELPIKTCILYLHLTRAECENLSPAKPLNSQVFYFNEVPFYLRASYKRECDAAWFEISVESDKLPQGASYICIAAAWSAVDLQYVTKRRWEIPLVHGHDPENMFGMFWQEFIQENNPWFADDKLYLNLDIFCTNFRTATR